MAIDELPDSEDVGVAIEKFAPFTGAATFFSERGILIATNSRSSFAEIGRKVFWEHKDYLQLQDIATLESPGQSISGFSIRLSDSEEDLNQAEYRESNVINHMLEALSDSRSDNMIVQHLHSDGENNLEGKIAFSYTSPGKVELVGRFNSEVDFRIVKKDDNEWDVSFFPERFTDQKRFQNAIQNSIPDRYEVYVIELSSLNHDERIDFFDEFLKSSFDNWRLEDVVGLKVRQPDGDFERADEDDIQEVDEEVLRGITEAILSGNNLRTNAIVVSFEKSGFYFQSMTMRYRNSRRPVVIDLKVFFKLRPVGLEVSIEQTFEVINGVEEPSALSKADQREYLRPFWNKAAQLAAKITRG